MFLEIFGISGHLILYGLAQNTQKPPAHKKVAVTIYGYGLGLARHIFASSDYLAVLSDDGQASRLAIDTDAQPLMAHRADLYALDGASGLCPDHARASSRLLR